MRRSYTDFEGTFHSVIGREVQEFTSTRGGVERNCALQGEDTPRNGSKLSRRYNLIVSTGSVSVLQCRP